MCIRDRYKVALSLFNADNFESRVYGLVLLGILTAYTLTQSMFGNTIVATGHRWYFLVLVGLSSAFVHLGSLGKSDNSQGVLK
jgi:hypothetical protein